MVTLTITPIAPKQSGGEIIIWVKGKPDEFLTADVAIAPNDTLLDLINAIETANPDWTSFRATIDIVRKPRSIT